MSYHWVKNKDPQYIQWCVANVVGFRLSPNDLKSLGDAAASMAVIKSAPGRCEHNPYDDGTELGDFAAFFMDEPF